MGFWSTILLSASIASIAAIGLYLQFRSGQFNVGMAVFVGVGGYVSGGLAVNTGMHPVLTLPIAVLAGFIAGAVFSALTLRLHHWFFAVTTLTLSVAAVSSIGFLPVLGGQLGLMNIPIINHPLPAVLGLASAFAIAFAIDRSRIGLAIRATGDDQILAQVFGVKVKRLRILVFGVGTAMAALAGALHAHRFGLYQPTDLGFHASLLLLVYVIIGGKNNIFGPLLGTFFLLFVPEMIKIAPEAELIVFGALMVIVAAWAPDGLAGIVETIARIFSAKTRLKSARTTSSVDLADDGVNRSQ
jgi:branched-chain amino acid transport system permease protein